MSIHSSTSFANPFREDLSTYKHVFTPEGREESGRYGIVSQDQHVWIYNSDFAKRWGMPEEWINNDLKGAQAIAFRTDTNGKRTCGYFRDQNNCRNKLICRMDVYFSSDTPIPWNTDQQSGFYPRFRDTSLHYLIPQKKEDHYAYSEQEKRRVIPLNPGISYAYIKSRNNGPMGLWHGKWQGIPYGSKLVEFYRGYLKGLDYVSFTLSCPDFRDAPKYDETVLYLRSTADKKLHPKTKYKWKTGLKDILYVDHFVTLPKPYLEKVKTKIAEYRKQTGQKLLYEEAVEKGITPATKGDN